nr:very low-density lipoprotein receptor-like [Lytechinus pictus]
MSYFVTGNTTVPSRIGNLSSKECPLGSRLVGDTCISLFLADDNRTASLSCQRIQSPSPVPLQRLVYVLGLLWPFRLKSIGTIIDIQGTYDYKEQILNPRPDDVSTEPCHMLEYNGFDWQLIEGDCTLHHNGSICYLIASDLVNICGEDMFECMNGECIRRVHVCDGRAECEGGEDERNCGESVYEDSEFVHFCPVSSFQCDMGRCISASFYCDFIPHCQDSSDEVNCAYPQCKADEFECGNGQCIEASKQCNIIPDCVDGSDEEFCQFCSDETFQCYDGTCIPGRSVCDGSLDCPGLNSEDEQSCESTDDKTLRCFNGEKFDARWRCVYDFDEYGLQLGCRDVTHLRDCGDLQCSGNMFKCPNSYCLPLRRRCDSVADCPGGEDEFECELYSCPGFLQCRGERYCVTDDQICDGVKDCTDGDDEMFCDIACPSGCSCDGLSFACDSFDAWTPQLAASFPIAARRIMISNVSEINRRKRSSDVRWNQTTIEDALYLDLSPFSLLLSL